MPYPLSGDRQAQVREGTPFERPATRITPVDPRRTPDPMSRPLYDIERPRGEKRSPDIRAQ
jgi:hypothetical protein